MADRNSIIEKIKALLSKTTANGATEAEMMSALDKASAMMSTYDITDEEVRLTKEEKATLHADPPDLKDPHKIKWRLTYAVSKFCGVQIYRSRRQTGLQCIGMPSDVELAMWLLDTLADFIFGELYTNLVSCLVPKSARHLFIRSFVEACCDRITDRLIALVEQSKVVCTSNGRELVVVKDAAIKAYMREHDIHIRTCGDYQSSTVDAAAHAAGQAAGNRASFGRPVSGAAGALRLGRAS